jgi:serine/threonine-protein kinase
VVVDLFAPQKDPLLGRTLDGRYEVLGRLGVGGVGVVYRAKQAHLGRFVAIKVLHPDAAASPEWRRRFEREARALSALAHPNIVPVSDSGIDRGVPYLVMELLQGKTLAELINEGPLPLWRALDIARQLLRGLAFAHGKAIVHRDLKPANVFLQALPDQADHVRLLDFGMAKFLSGHSSRTMTDTLTRVGVVFGTPAYMSPEQIKAATVDARSDVYAAGVLLFELLAGRRPYVAEDHEGYIAAHLSEPIPSLAKVHPNLASAPLFQQVIEKAMAKKPGSRFKDAAVMLAALEAVIAKLPSAATAPGRAVRRKSAPHPKAGSGSGSGSLSRFLRRAIVVVTLAGGLAAAATYLIRDAGRPSETAAPRPKPQPSSKLKPPAPPPKVVPEPTPPEPTPPPPAPPETAAVPTTATPPAPSPPSPTPPPKPEPAVPPPAEAKAPLAVKAPAATKPPAESPEETGSAARDPWRAPVPRALKPIRDRVVRGAKMSQKALKPVYAFARENPDDPRPWLLLGRAYAELDWYSDSVDRYLKAYRVDAASRGDPHMLTDLVKAAAHPTAGRNAARAVRDIYGAEAIPALEKAIGRAGNGEAGARLARLREAL